LLLPYIYLINVSSFLKRTAFFFQSAFFIKGVPDEYVPDSFIDLVIKVIAVM